MLRVLSRPTLSGRRELNPVSSHLLPKQLATHPCLVHMALEAIRDVRAPGGGCTLQGGGDARSSAFARLIVSGRRRSRQTGSKRSILPDMCPGQQQLIRRASRTLPKLGWAVHWNRCYGRLMRQSQMTVLEHLFGSLSHCRTVGSYTARVGTAFSHTHENAVMRISMRVCDLLNSAHMSARPCSSGTGSTVAGLTRTARLIGQAPFACDRVGG